MKCFDQKGCRSQGAKPHSLHAIVRHFDTNFSDTARKKLEYFAAMPTLPDAIRAAARSEGENGKRLLHQCRITKAAIREATAGLVKAADWFDECTDFDQIFDEVERTILD